jgi:fibronectin-binding autotransporter adhesin
VADSTWTGAVNSLWNIPGNWTAGVPGAGFTATFNGTASVGIDALGTGVGRIVVVAGTVTLTASGGNLDTGAGMELSPGAGTSLIVSTGIGGTGGVTKTGSGTASLTSTNSYTGATLVSAGVLTAASGALNGTSGVTNNATLNAVNIKAGASVSGSGTTAFSGSALTLGAVNITGPVSLTAVTGAHIISALLGSGNFAVSAPSLIIQNGGTTYSGTLSGICTVFMPSAGGAFTLTGANTFGGGATINGGIIIAGNAGAFGSGTIVLNGGTLNLNSLAVANTISYSGGTLTNGGSYVGPVTVATGLFNASTVPNASSFLVANGANLNLGGGVLSKPVSVTGGSLLNGAIAASNLSFPSLTSDVALNVALTGATPLSIPAYPFTVTLGVFSSFSGNLSIGAGATFKIASAAAIGSGNHPGAISGSGSIRLEGAQILSGVVTVSRVVVARTIGQVQITNPANNATVDVVGAGNGFRATVAGAVDAYVLHDGTLDLNALDANGIVSYGGSIANGQNYTGGTVLVVGPDAGSSGVTTLVPGPAFGPALSGGTAVIGTGVGGTLEIPIGASVTGLVDNGGVLGPGGGVVVVADDGTPRTPMGAYGGRCGSTYAVRQF